MKFHHVAITVKNLERSRRFYQDSFGFKEVNRFTKPGWDGNAVVMALGDMLLELFSFKGYSEKKDDLSDLKVTGLKHIGIQVDDVRKEHARLKAMGADIDKPVKGTTCAWFCFLLDPDGIPIELYEPK